MNNKENLTSALERLKNNKYLLGIGESIYWLGKIVLEGKDNIEESIKQSLPPEKPISVKKFCMDLIERGETYLMPSNVNDFFRKDPIFFKDTFNQDGKFASLSIYKIKLIKKLIEYFSKRKTHEETQILLKNYLKELQEAEHGQ
jgi:hypothetical protein